MIPKNSVSISTSFFKWIPFFIAILIPVLFIVPTYFAYTGFSLSIILLASFLFYLKPNPTREVWTWYTFSLVFGLLFLIKSNDSLLFIFNLLGALYSLSLLFLQTQDWIKYNFWDLLFAPLIATIKVIETKTSYYPSFTSLPKFFDKKNTDKADKTTQTSNLGQILIGVGVSLLLLSIILPLLASANPLFARNINNILEFFNPFSLIGDILNFIFDGLTFLRVIVFFILFLILPRAISYIETPITDKKYTPKTFKHHLLFLIPKITVSLVLLLFFISQLQLYFASSQDLINLGYNYGQLNQEVFGQLAVVSLIIFGLIFFDKSKQKANINWDWVLLTQTVFLNFIATKSVIDYINTWGLSFLRLYGISMVILVLGIQILFILKFIKKIEDFKFLKQVIIFVFSLLILVNLVNFDYMIYKNLPIETKGTDYRYYSRLGYDAYDLDQILATFEKLQYEEKQNYTYEIDSVLFKVKYLQTKYSSFRFRSFNLTEYLVYQKVKNIDVTSKTTQNQMASNNFDLPKKLPMPSMPGEPNLESQFENGSNQPQLPIPSEPSNSQ